MSTVPHPLRALDASADGTRAVAAESYAKGTQTRFAGLSAADAVLVSAVQRGEDGAFASLLKTHQRLVYGFLRARLLEPADAEDLCQEVFLRCYEGREKLVRATTIGSWLIGIARNLLREYVRRQSRRKEVAWTELCIEIDNLAQSPMSGMDDALIHLPDCLQSLGPSAREAIELYYRDDRRMSQIGERMKRSEGAVKLLMHRARLALKNCLERRLQKNPIS